MTRARLPVSIDLAHFTESEQYLSGSIPLEKMSRLVEIHRVEALSGEVAVELSGRQQQGLRLLSGKVVGVVPLICQRCMKAFTQTVAAEFNLMWINSEAQRQEIPPDYEPLLVEEDELNLIKLVEDELLLALPIIDLHPIEDCEVKQGSWRFGQELDDGELAKKTNPFSQLADLKKIKK